MANEWIFGNEDTVGWAPDLLEQKQWKIAGLAHISSVSGWKFQPDPIGASSDGSSPQFYTQGRKVVLEMLIEQSNALSDEVHSSLEFQDYGMQSGPLQIGSLKWKHGKYLVITNFLIRNSNPSKLSNRVSELLGGIHNLAGGFGSDQKQINQDSSEWSPRSRPRKI